jgi:hypothetical protein
MAETAEPLTRACELVGRFFYHFGRVELQLDEAITKLFNLDPAYAPIVTANFDFYKKLNVVRCAAALQAKAGMQIINVKRTLGGIEQMNNDRQVLAHSSFQEAEGEVRFKRTTAKGKLKAEEALWTVTDFAGRFRKLQRLEAELKQIVGGLEPKRIKWPKAASLAPLPAAYLAPAFFMYLGDATNRSGTPLALREAARRERKARNKFGQ